MPDNRPNLDDQRCDTAPWTRLPDGGAWWRQAAIPLVYDRVLLARRTGIVKMHRPAAASTMMAISSLVAQAQIAPPGGPRRSWLRGGPSRKPPRRTITGPRAAGAVARATGAETTNGAPPGRAAAGSGKAKGNARAAAARATDTRPIDGKRGWKTARLPRKAGDITQLRQRGGLPGGTVP